MSYCYLNGETLPYKECNLHISDLLLQRGYGVFDFFRAREGQIPFLRDYTDRLYNSIRLSDIEAPLSREEFTSIIYDLQQKNGPNNEAFKVIVTGGYSDNLEAVTGAANMIILNIPWHRPPHDTLQKGVNLITSEYQRPNPEVKTLYYFNSMRLAKKLKEFDAVDVLYHTSTITETSRASIFFVEGANIYTPEKNILKGITRKQILSKFKEIIVEDIEINRLHNFDEVFISSTSRDITPVVSVDGKMIGTGKPGKVTMEVMSEFGK
jgi:branched-chain amino acid aminotransferase